MMTGPAAPPANLARWKAVVKGGSTPQALAEILHEDAVFHSPVVHTPQRGKRMVMAYLGAAGKVLGNDSFTYAREIVDGDEIVLEFTCELDGIHVNGGDIIRFDADGRIIDFKVMVRPLKAINKVWEAMGARLAGRS